MTTKTKTAPKNTVTLVKKSDVLHGRLGKRTHAIHEFMFALPASQFVSIREIENGAQCRAAAPHMAHQMQSDRDFIEYSAEKRGYRLKSEARKMYADWRKFNLKHIAAWHQFYLKHNAVKAEPKKIAKKK